MKKVILSVLLICCLSCFAQKTNTQPYLVVLSMDGFRWDYVDSFPTPNLHSIIKKGVSAKSAIPSFPTVTFPNHYTMATGLYPDHHGIINNNFYDSELGVYKMSDNSKASDGRFYGGEPIWVSARMQGYTTANYFWPGSEAEIKGMRPNYWKKFNTKDTYQQRIDTVIHWLSLPEASRPHLVMFYFDDPDHLTHSVGPFGSEVRNMVMYLDSMVGQLLSKIQTLPIGQQVNIMFVSDHGMEAVSETRTVELDKYIRKDWCDKINGHNYLITINPKQGYSDSILNGLALAPHLKVWRKKDLPERFHYGSNARIGDIVLLADSAYSMTWPDYKLTVRGNHGYDNLNTNMHGIFYAIGPAFKTDYLQPAFENVNLYELMAKILKIIPAKNDGNIDAVKGMLK